MTAVQRVAQVIGWAFVVVAIWGFFVSGGSMEADPEVAPRIMGLFPVNLLHNLVHLAFGIWGILAARSFAAAKSYGMIAGVVYLLLAALGFVAPSMFGLVPIGGHDIWLHVLLGGVLAVAGFTASAPPEPAVAGSRGAGRASAEAAGNAPGGAYSESPPPPAPREPPPSEGTMPPTGDTTPERARSEPAEPPARQPEDDERLP